MYYTEQQKTNRKGKYMKQTCDYCGNYIKDTDEVCPHCGGTNSHVVRTAKGLPKTVEELKAYAEANNLPLEKMRFFIGENYHGARAFGIYEENGVFTVYKNKADGTRAVRYSGRDEAYAVNELYQKMHSEIMLRKNKKKSKSDSSASKNLAGCVSDLPGCAGGCLGEIVKANFKWVIIGVVALIIAIAGNSCAKNPSRGYYSYNDSTYYYQHGTWYGYNDADGWFVTTPGSELTDNYDDYYNGRGYQSGSGYSDFGDSDYYHDDSYWDSGNDWDNDSWDNDMDWDSGDTDWGSDW